MLKDVLKFLVKSGEYQVHEKLLGSKKALQVRTLCNTGTKEVARIRYASFCDDGCRASVLGFIL